jgi:predicted amidohydrolase
MVGRYRKRTIKDEETLWFSAGDAAPVFEHDGLKFGISVCADISNEDIFADCARQGARIVFELAAPGLYGKQESRNWLTGFEWWRDECQIYLRDYARIYSLWIAVATQAGRTVDEDFPGGGFVFGPDGQCLFATPDGSPGAVFLELDLERHTVKLL